MGAKGKRMGELEWEVGVSRCKFFLKEFLCGPFKVFTELVIILFCFMVLFCFVLFCLAMRDMCSCTGIELD